MKKLFLIPVILLIAGLSASAQNTLPLASWPDSIYTGKQGDMHVQGVAVDKKNGYVYFSFTDKLIKMDLSGKIVGSVTGFVGHLGDLDFNEDDGKIYGSLEYKNDEIGKGIRKKLGIQKNGEIGFYVAMFDGARIVRVDMNAEKEDLLRTVYIPEVVKDYDDSVHVGNQLKPHRFACSGMDGLAFAPAVGGAADSKKYIYIAYGVYGDTDRNDNDYQLILKYDYTKWNKYAQHLSQDHLHHSGPEKPMEKYFVKTGSTRYGIQNLAYDQQSGNLFAAVYRGAKKQFPNYDLFVINMHQKSVKERIPSDNKEIKVKTLSLLQAGPADAKTGIRGWYFPWGSTGLCPLGDGLFYISHNEKTKDGQQQSTIHKYKWVGDAQNSFVLVK